MAKQFGFFNSINGDRKYLATDISNAFDTTTNNGLKAVQDSFKIVPSENMTVKMMPGGCMIFGHYCLDDEEEIIQLDTADAELDRIDRIVVRYDKFERSIKTVVVKGTPALTPTPPAVLRNKNQFDLVLADIRINKATTEITTANITDMRESELCGFIGVKGAASEIELKNHIEGPFHIVESGQNANGSYVKFADGTLVCWQNLEITYDKLTTGTLVINWVFPSAFADNGYTHLCNLGVASTSDAGKIDFIAPKRNISSEKTSTSCYIGVKSNFGSSAVLMQRATGRWK